MRIIRTIILLIIIYIVPVSLYSNEKYKKNNESSSTSIKSNDTENTPNLYGSKNDKKDDITIKYRRRARGLLAMGIIGTVLSPAFFSIPFITYYSMVDFDLTTFDPKRLIGIVIAECFISIFSIAIPINMIVWGFLGHNYYKKKMATDPFIKFNVFNKNLTFGVNINF